MSDAPLKAIVVGARRRRQGIGAFVARALVEAGAEVQAVVGTSQETAAEAASDLAGLGPCHPHAALRTALEAEDADLVALCSPFEAHHDQLLEIAASGRHCLCEKPLWWGPESGAATETREAATDTIVDAYARRSLHLALVAQWPQTLAAHRLLYPETAAVPARFRMRLSPASSGPSTILDALPHPLSMLQRLAGAGRLEEVAVEFPDPRTARVRFRYVHGAGAIASLVHLETCEEPPRPAGYSLDDDEVDRHILLPEYEQYFQTPEGRSVPVPDPLPLLATEFLAAVRSGRPPERTLLLQSITHLETLWEASRRAWDLR